MKTENRPIAVFPAPAPHKLKCAAPLPFGVKNCRRSGGAGSVEIKHTHPQHASQEERQERLKDVRRTCAALIRARREKAEQRRKRSA